MCWSWKISGTKLNTSNHQKQWRASIQNRLEAAFTETQKSIYKLTCSSSLHSMLWFLAPTEEDRGNKHWTNKPQTCNHSVLRKPIWSPVMVMLFVPSNVVCQRVDRAKKAVLVKINSCLSQRQQQRRPLNGQLVQEQKNKLPNTSILILTCF